jgi:hypothetical protein
LSGVDGGAGRRDLYVVFDEPGTRLRDLVLTGPISTVDAR